MLNADDPLLVERSRGIPAPINWFTLNPASELVARHLEHGGHRRGGRQREDRAGPGRAAGTLLPIAEIPITFAGAAQHNVANVAGRGGSGGCPGHSGAGDDSGAAALRATAGRQSRAGQSHRAGRAFEILLDFAHNPHGMLALVAVAKTIPAQRRLLLVGQAGDRSDEAIRELARAAWTSGRTTSWSRKWRAISGAGRWARSLPCWPTSSLGWASPKGGSPGLGPEIAGVRRVAGVGPAGRSAGARGAPGSGGGDGAPGWPEPGELEGRAASASRVRAVTEDRPLSSLVGHLRAGFPLFWTTGLPNPILG